MEKADQSSQFKQTGSYVHSKYEIRRNFSRFVLRLFIPLLVKINSVTGQENIPKTGPVILMINHIAFIDPIIIMPFTGRNIVPLAKIEVYDYPIVGIVPRFYGVIPVRREEFDRRAIQKSLEVSALVKSSSLHQKGRVRTKAERRERRHRDLASRSGAVIVPTAVDGTIGFPALRFSSRWRGSGVQIHFGTPFRYRQEYRRASGEQLRTMTTEAMYQLSSYLTPERRGYYGILDQTSTETIELLSIQQ